MILKFFFMTCIAFAYKGCRDSDADLVGLNRTNMSGISLLRVEGDQGRVCRDCSIKIQEYEFLGDLIELAFKEFDVILGMDWLSRHQVMVDCRMKRVTLRTLNDNEVIFIGERSNHLSNVISAVIARKMVRKGCEAYLDYVIDTVKTRPSVFDILTVSDFPDVFPEELSGLPPHREIEFAIDVVSGATPASITPYIMAPLELKELKLQLQELLEKCEI